jgi:hypothetical protein
MHKIAGPADAGIDHFVLQLAQHNAWCNRFWTVGIVIEVLEVFGTARQQHNGQQGGDVWLCTLYHGCLFKMD